MIQTTLPAAVRLILGAETDVVWRDRAEGAAWRSPANVKLSIQSTARIGVDESRLEVEGEGETDLRETIGGNRRLTIQFEVETDDQDITSSAHEVADTICAGLYRTDVTELLATSGLGEGQTQPIREVRYKDAHGRWRSVVVFEVFFPWTRTHVGALIPRVRSVEFEGEVDDLVIGPTLVDL